ncbi:hypothetical protein BaRGS_00015788, partial [Batillaria attramentaria]
MSDRLARFVLTLLHVLTAMAAAGCLLSVLVDWEQVNQNDCSPVNGTESYTLSQTCTAIEYGDGILSGLSLLMAVGISCFWGRWGCADAASADDKQTSKSTMMAYYRKMALQQ